LLEPRPEFSERIVRHHQHVADEGEGQPPEPGVNLTNQVGLNLLGQDRSVKYELGLLQAWSSMRAWDLECWLSTKTRPTQAWAFGLFRKARASMSGSGLGPTRPYYLRGKLNGGLEPILRLQFTATMSVLW
jgi:hypothetical protein